MCGPYGVGAAARSGLWRAARRAAPTASQWIFQFRCPANRFFLSLGLYWNHQRDRGTMNRDPEKGECSIMKFKVNQDTCIGCGLCEGTCPAVFHMTDAGVAEAIPDDVPAGEEANAQAALEGCPVGAIEKVEG